MIDKNAVRARIEETGIIPSVRATSAEDAVFAAEAVSRAGIPIIEITMTVPDAVHVIAELVRDRPEVIVGADVGDLETARRCVEGGARFLTSPGFDPRMVEYAIQQGVLVLPGALTPTEVSAAWQAGSDFVKVFPCAPLGGDSYIRALKGPYPQVPLVAAGGVNQQTAGEFIRAGAVAIGVGTELIPKKAVRLRQGDWIAELARRFLGLVQEARQHRNSPGRR